MASRGVSSARAMPAESTPMHPLVDVILTWCTRSRGGRWAQEAQASCKPLTVDRGSSSAVTQRHSSVQQHSSAQQHPAARNQGCSPSGTDRSGSLQ